MSIKQLSDADIKRMIKDIQSEDIQSSKRFHDFNYIVRQIDKGRPIEEDQKHFIVKMYNEYFLSGKVGR